MTLRELVFDVAFKGSTRNIKEMDSAVDELKETTESATDELTNMDTATEELGRTTGGVTKFMKDNWAKVTIAMGALGIGIEKLARDQAGLTETNNRLAYTTDMSSDAMRELVLATTDVTFPITDVIDLFEVASKQGIRSAKEMQEFALFWDMIGDATGENATSLAESSVALRALGIEAGNESQALAAFGYVTQDTNASVSDLLTFVERTGPQLRELGLDINDTAAMMGILEHELGMTSRVARTEFRKAVGEADGDLQTMLQTLGVSSEVFEEYRGSVMDANGVIQANADNHAETYTIMQKLGQGLQAFIFSNGELIGSLSTLTPILMGIGPLMKIASAGAALYSKISIGALVPAIIAKTAAMWAFTVALLANPITLIIVAIVALVAAAWLLVKNWDLVTDFVVKALNYLWEVLKAVFEGILKVIIYTNPALIIIKHWEDIMNFVSGLGKRFYDYGANIISSMIDGIKSMFKNAYNTVKDFGKGIANSFTSFFGISSPSKLMIEYGTELPAGLEIGVEKGAPDAVDSMQKMLNPETTQTTQTNNSTTSFAPNVRIQVAGGGAGGGSITGALEREFDSFLSRYEKKMRMRLGV